MDKGGESIDYDKLEQSLLAALEPLNHLRLDPSRVQTGTKIGSGGFGDVLHATLKTRVSWYKVQKLPVVVKQLRTTGAKERRLRVVVALARELVVWSRFQHPNVLGLLGFYFDDVNFSYACAVTEFQENGNILEYLKPLERDENRLLQLVQETASGLAYLHSLEPPVCHGDIKPENTLVSKRGTAMICDFGLAKAIEDGPSGLTTSTQPFTARYASPEVLNDASLHILESDVWSWGCLFYQVFSGKIPYSDLVSLGAIYSAATNGQLPGTLDELECSDRIKDLLRYCWGFKHELRPTMKACERIVLECRPDYDRVSEYFRGVTVTFPVGLQEPFGGRMGDFDFAYHAHLERTVDVKSVTTLKTPGKSLARSFALAPNGKMVVVGLGGYLRRYNAAMTQEKSYTLGHLSIPEKFCCSTDAKMVAFTLKDRNLFTCDFSRKPKQLYPFGGGQMPDVQDMCFANSNQLLLVLWRGGTLDALPLHDGDQPYRLANYVTWMDLSPQHPVIVITTVQGRTQLVDIKAAAVLQEFPCSWGVGFKPDGLGLILQKIEGCEVSIWDFTSASIAGSASASYSLSPGGLPGRFVKTSLITCPPTRGYDKTSVSSDGVLACGAFAEVLRQGPYGNAAQIRGAHIWNLKTRRTLFTVFFNHEDDLLRTTISQIYLRPGSTAAAGYIDFIYDTSSAKWKGAPSFDGYYGYRVKYAARDPAMGQPIPASPIL